MQSIHPLTPFFPAVKPPKTSTALRGCTSQVQPWGRQLRDNGGDRPEPPAPRAGPAKASGTRAALTEEPAQNAHEFFTCGELLSDSAPKLSATMQQPRISCSSPSDKSGRAGSSAEPGAAAAAAAARREESAGGAASTPAALAAQRGRPGGCSAARGQRGRSGGSGASWEAVAAAPGPPACGPPASPATGQQEPGSTTGRDMDRRRRERPVAAGRGRGAQPRAPRTGHAGGLRGGGGGKEMHTAQPLAAAAAAFAAAGRLSPAAPTCQPAGPPPAVRARLTPTRAHPRAPCAPTALLCVALAPFGVQPPELRKMHPAPNLTIGP